MEIVKTIMSYCRNRLRIYLLATTILIMGIIPVFAQLNAPEYQVKAVFIYNFLQFIEWPDESFQDAESPLVIGILGKDPFGAYLHKAVNGEKLDQHPLIIRRFRKPEDVTDCHILFIGKTNPNTLSQILNETKDKPILTVSDSREFCQLGGIIEFLKVDNKIKLAINPQAAENAQLNVSSKLLRLAKIVSNEEGTN